jgi:aldehyde dehydrogenase (NAD+)
MSSHKRPKMTIEKSKIETRLFINGQFVNSVSGRTFKTINPATEEVICEVQEGDARDVDLAVRRWFLRIAADVIC